METIGEILKKFKFEIVKLGYFGKNFRTNPNLRCDENFYLQANVPHAYRWDKFNFERNYEKENRLKELLVTSNEPYIFIHEDPKRKFIIERKYFNSDLKIVSPRIDLSSQFTIFDYLSIIENATEIHCIESSFSILLDNINLPLSKFIHRYARPEAKFDYTYEFTYRSQWMIFK